MSNEATQNKQIGLRIRAARKEKKINQTKLAKLLGKSLRTVQKYESGEIEVSLAVLNDIAKVLDCDSSYLIGYEMKEQELDHFSDFINFLFRLEQLKDIGFGIEVKRPPKYDGWECSITFNGKDTSHEINQDICLFLEDFKSMREEYLCEMISTEKYRKWQDQTLAYYANLRLKQFSDLKQDDLK
ncbi:MAG: helix-turn-helix transcriptional regulator [Eubacteriales bacterium]|nr:helix-turn-helix transcriptional regulator [Eubacteriales bacterium]